jgi:NAD dependent epimerase/dehydratase family enzyme
MVYGQAATVILNSQRCVPSRLEQAGFVFRFQDMGTALEDVCTP